MDGLRLFVWNNEITKKIPVDVSPATPSDLQNTEDWQTRWTTEDAKSMPNKVALHCVNDRELLGLMSYELDDAGLAVEIIYIESAGHSNANLVGREKKYVGVAKALIAYAVKVSIDAGYGGVLYFKAKTDRLREYYMEAFGAMPVGHYDPYRLVIWDDAAEQIIAEFMEV